MLFPHGLYNDYECDEPNIGHFLLVWMNYNNHKTSNPKEAKVNLQVGQSAPDFTLPSQLDREVTLSNLRGNTVVIAFFPLAWTPI